ncbi:chromatin assembly factor 1 subunit A [Lucilia sericata]|uniref:chromatin assembly factor 1 subunit A n=1 Tax=Lucilia sericata TaxID=13632 RepID=UPI0018A869BE|nr:chromatin assembly factor 1 subunit A [Lucilia sericata]
MRNSTSGSTPKTNTVQDDSVSTNNNAEKSSAKKLKQARLPFKVIAPGTSPVGSKTTATPLTTAGDKDKDSHSTDGRKRKLSYDDTDDDVASGAVVLIDADDNVSKENVEILKAATKKKKTNNKEHTTSEVVVSLLDDDDDEDVEGETNNEDINNTSVISAVGKKDLALKTPKATAKDKRNGAGTPQTSSAQKDKNGSASKLQIKLPLSAGKKKRRKSKLHQLSSLNNSTAEGSHNHSAQELSSDDIEEIAVEQNPQKRKKLNTECDVDDGDKTKNAKSKNDEQEQEVETITLDSEHEEEKEVEEVKSKTTVTRSITKTLSGKDNSKKESSKKPSEQSIKNWTVNKTTNKEKETKQELKNKTSPQTKNQSPEESPEDEEKDEIQQISSSSDEEKIENPENDKEEELDESVLSDNDNEADDERDNLNGKGANVSSDMSENSKTKHNSTLESLKDGKSMKSTSTKNQTPKQAKLMEQRRKAREEKERKLQEEKLKKQQEKEEKELAKKREREEKEEQRRKEREEKEEQKRKERDEKERKRLAELEVKNEEKRKKNEAREEELRKKEEERKRKEQEKEEAELKKKKAAQAFTKFFVAKTPNQAQLKNEEDSNTGDDNKLLAFRPFQVKGDMKLAPVIRKIFTPEAKNRLDNLLGCKNDDDDEEEDVVRRKPLPKTQLYLSELRSGKILPGKWRRPSTESKDDVILVEDELERVGQEIVEDTPAYIREEMRVKFYKFHDNRRPPYYGTWRKKSAVVKPRKPFAQDKKFFDYEVDSDDEWEEEEPGESLEDGSDDDKEKESEDDDYEVDNEWFVPHGHLSDEELQNEDEFGMGDDNTREAQKAKLQILQQEFAQEMKKKTEKIKPRLIGCIWTDINGNQPAECARILWDTLEKKAMLFTEPPLVEEPEGDRSAEPSLSPSGATNGNVEKPNAEKLKPISLSDSMIKDLIRLLHGNNHSKNFLINEFIAYIEKTEESVKNGDLRKPLKSVVRDKIDEMAEWQAIDATAATMLEVEQANDDAATDGAKKKKKAKRRLCWVVKQDSLNKMELPSLELQNSWEYTLPPKFVKSDKEVKTDENESTTTTPVVAEDSAKGKNAATSQITKFTKVLTAEEKASKLQNSPASTTNTSSSTDKFGGTETKSNTPTTSKEKKRVPLLMSVARGQQIPTPAKNKLISQFLQQKGKDNAKPSSSPTTTSRSKTVISPQVEDDDVVILD